MKKSLNAWTVDPAAGFEKLFADLKAAGFDAVELNVDKEGYSAHSLTLATTPDELAAIRELSERYALPVASISTSLWGGRMGRDPEFAETLLRQQLLCAKALGGRSVLTVPGGDYPRVSLAQDREACIGFLRSRRELIHEFGLDVGVENVWNGFFASPLDMTSFIDAVDDPLVGAYYDVGNVIAFSWSERWIEALGGRIRSVHVKDFRRTRGINSGGEWVDIPLGDVDWKAVIPALRAAGFDGCLTGEVSKSDPEQSYEDYYAFVAESIGKLLEY